MKLHEALKIPLIDVFNAYNIRFSHQIGNNSYYFSPFVEQKTGSIHFFKKGHLQKWHDFASGLGGDVVNFVRWIESCDTAKALEILECSFFSAVNYSHSAEPVETAEDIARQAVTHVYNTVKIGSLLAYMQERNLPNRIVKEYRYTYKGRNYYAFGMENLSGGIEIRSKYSKSCIGAKDLIVIETKSNDWIVFEGITDFLSAISYYQKQPQKNVLILTSTSLVKRAITFLGQKQVGKLYCYLDNDDAGQKAFNHFSQVFSCKNISSELYPNFNDFNAFICQKH